MDVSTIVVILFLVVGVIFLMVFVIKSVMSPKKVESINRLTKQGKITQAIKLAKTLIQKDPQDTRNSAYPSCTLA